MTNGREGEIFLIRKGNSVNILIYMGSNVKKVGLGFLHGLGCRAGPKSSGLLSKMAKFWTTLVKKKKEGKLSYIYVFFTK